VGAAFPIASWRARDRRRRCARQVPDSREHARHRRQVADILVHHPEEGNDGRLVGGDAVEIAHSVCLGCVVPAPRRQLLQDATTHPLRLLALPAVKESFQ
jgi:hypothetical protein